MSVKQIENGISKQQLAQFKAILENWQTQLLTGSRFNRQGAVHHLMILCLILPIAPLTRI